MKKHPMLKYIKEEGPCGSRMPLIMCPGCGSGQVLNQTLQAVDRIITEDGLANVSDPAFIAISCYYAKFYCLCIHTLYLVFKMPDEQLVVIGMDHLFEKFSICQEFIGIVTGDTLTRR